MTKRGKRVLPILGFVLAIGVLVGALAATHEGKIEEKLVVCGTCIITLLGLFAVILHELSRIKRLWLKLFRRPIRSKRNSYANAVGKSLPNHLEIARGNASIRAAIVITEQSASGNLEPASTAKSTILPQKEPLFFEI
jgi:hypothetical protein